MIKVVTLFLAFMAVLALFGRIWIPGRGLKRLKCPGCGRYEIGKGPCDCGKGA